MSDEKKPLGEDAQSVSSTKTGSIVTTSSEVTQDPFSDKNETASTASRRESEETVTAPEKESQETSSASPPKSPPVPSHSTLAFANYPPLWSQERKHAPKSKSPPAKSRTSSGFSAATLSAVMSSGSSEAEKARDKRAAKRFEAKDPSNKHEYLQHPDQPYSRPQLNIFGRDIGGLGKKPPGLGFGRKKK